VFSSSYYAVKASVEFVSGSMDFPLILPVKMFEKDLVGRAADSMRNFVTFECF